MALTGTEIEALQSVAVGAGLGLAIGLERGWKELDQAKKGAAGIRTFTLVGLLGALAGWMQASSAIDAVVPGLIGVLVLTAISHGLEVWRGGDVGLTSEFALLITFLLGVTAGLGYWLPAAGTAVAVALILGLKTSIHDALRRLNKGELLATLQLLVLAVLVVPILPDYEVFDISGLVPRTIGLFTLLVSAFSYVGYFCIQLLGQRKGILLAAGFGGMTSSTAVTLSFARLSRDNGKSPTELGAGVGIACAVMAPRLLIVVSLVAPSIAGALIWTLLPLALCPMFGALWQLRQSARRAKQPLLTLKNPLALGTALTFAGLLMVLFIAVPLVSEWVGPGGVYILAAVSGITDVDAISLTLAKDFQDSGLKEMQVVQAITLAAGANSLFKAGLLAVVSRGVLNATAVSIVIGAVTSMFVIWFI